MATTADRLTHLNTTKGLIKDAIIAKGVAVPDTTPFRQYADKIAAIPQEGGVTPSEPSGDGWTRPTDRPAVPTVNENEIYMLFGVIATGPNDYAITLTAVGGYTVDWGDGTVETIGSGVKCQHMYNYSSLSVTPNAGGVKWVWIKFTGSFTIINTNVRHSLRPTASSSAIFVPQVYEMYLNAPNVNTWNWDPWTYTIFKQLDIFNWEGLNKLTSLFSFLMSSANLKRLLLFTGLCTNFDNFLYECYSFNQPLNIDTSNGTSFNGFLIYCYAFNQPLNIDTSKSVDLHAFLRQCRSFNQPLNIDTSKNKIFSYFMYDTPSQTYPISVDFTSTTTALATSFIGAFNYALTGLRLLNMGSIHTVLTISNSSLGVAELVALFGDLYDRSATTKGTITITNVFGASQLTAEQRAIAQNKNWTIVG